jgi:glutaconyl-CoA/methylmalonyl-CoA decarboxylase subunit gamma
MRKYTLRVNGNIYEVEILKAEGEGLIANVSESAAKSASAIKTETSASAAQPAESPVNTNLKVAGTIKSPLPGIIRSLEVKPGQQVKQGDKLLILEAMKMENNITAEMDGTVMTVFFNVGDSVMEGEPLIEIGT